MHDTLREAAGVQYRYPARMTIVGKLLWKSLRLLSEFTKSFHILILHKDKESVSVFLKTKNAFPELFLQKERRILIQYITS